MKQKIATKDIYETKQKHIKVNKMYELRQGNKFVQLL